MGFDYREDKHEAKNVGGRGRKSPSHNHEVCQLGTTRTLWPPGALGFLDDSLVPSLVTPPRRPNRTALRLSLHPQGNHPNIDNHSPKSQYPGVAKHLRVRVSGLRVLEGAGELTEVKARGTPGAWHVSHEAISRSWDRGSVHSARSARAATKSPHRPDHRADAYQSRAQLRISHEEKGAKGWGPETKP